MIWRLGGGVQAKWNYLWGASTGTDRAGGALRGQAGLRWLKNGGGIPKKLRQGLRSQVSSLVQELLQKRSEHWRFYWFCLVISLGKEVGNSLKWIFSVNGFSFLAPATELQCKREGVTLGPVRGPRGRDEPRGRSEEGAGARGLIPVHTDGQLTFTECQGVLANPSPALATRWKCPGPRAGASRCLAWKTSA